MSEKRQHTPEQKAKDSSTPATPVRGGGLFSVLGSANEGVIAAGITKWMQATNRILYGSPPAPPAEPAENDQEAATQESAATESTQSDVKDTGKRIRRKQRKKSNTSPLTERQLEAVQVVGECQGNIAEAARRIGKDYSTVKQHYEAAMGKLGKEAVKHSTTSLQTDRREQVQLDAGDDRRNL